MLGSGYSARRYVRLLDQPIGDLTKMVDVFLVPMALIDLSAAPDLWTDFKTIRVASFHKLQITDDSGSSRNYVRKTMFGPLFRVEESGNVVEVAANTFKCLEQFFSLGENVAVGSKYVGGQQEKLGFDSGVLLQVNVEDFLGLTYHFDIGEEQEPSRAQLARAELSMGMLNSGQAQSTVKYRLGVSVVDKPLNAIERELVKHNLLVENRMRDRYSVAQWSQVECLLNAEEN